MVNGEGTNAELSVHSEDELHIEVPALYYDRPTKTFCRRLDCLHAGLNTTHLTTNRL